LREPRRWPASSHGATTLAAAVLVLGVLASGCGAAAPDLFEVKRSGRDPNANLTLVVSDGGEVSCNGIERPLGGDRLLRARELVRQLAPQAELGLELPPGPGSTLRYEARMEAGHVAFSDRSRRRPQSFNVLVAFTSDVAERVCGIER
jgi:hypothetical protein